MKDYKNFKIYQPDDESRKSLQAEHGVVFFKSENGEDWYDVQKTFLPDTLKIAYDEDGIIRSISHDVSMLTPADLSVVEVVDSEENQKADIYGEWVYKDGKILPREYAPSELINQAEEKKAALLASAEATIAPLARAVKLGIASSEEITLLDAWERYSIIVNRINTQLAPDFVWPELPVKKES